MAAKNWSDEQKTTSDHALARGVWKHISYTQTGTTGVLYENGVEVARNTNVAIKPSAVGGGTTTLDYLGRSMYDADKLFKGRMRDFRVYNRALELAEVQRLAGRVKPSPLAADKAALKLDGLDDVTGDLTLPRIGAGGSAINWKSSDTAVLSDEGKVTRPALGRPDAHLTLTATLSWAGATETKRFDVTVRAEFNDSTKANRARDALVVHDIDDVRGNLTLPTKGQYGADITWDSKRKDVIADDGTVHRPAPGTRAIELNLIATVNVNGSKASRTFQAKVPPLPAKQDLKGYLFSYFTGEGKADGEQIYFALSKGNDALHWRELNNGKPALQSTKGEKGVRDPYIIRSPEGDKFYQIATDLKINGGKGWGYEMQHGSLYLEIWESTDLVHWSKQRHVRVSADTAGMTWAPEATYDPKLGAYVVYWASNLYSADDPNHTGSTYPRMMYATTRDFHTFSEPKVWNDPGRGVIDSTVIRHGDYYYRFTTDDAPHRLLRTRRRPGALEVADRGRPARHQAPQLAAGLRLHQDAGRHGLGGGTHGVQVQHRGQVVPVRRRNPQARLPAVRDHRPRRREVEDVHRLRAAGEPASRDSAAGDTGRVRRAPAGLPA